MGSLNRATLTRVVKRGPVRWAGRAVRTAIVPEREMLVSAVGRLSDRIAALRRDHEADRRTVGAHATQVHGLRQEADELRTQTAELYEQVAELQGELTEARRLNLRVAELTDLMTELVLPLHNRDIDIERLHSHTADTL